MSPGARADARISRLGIAVIAAVTLWRVALLPFDRADLFVDDAQYWLWGQDLAWGYYSKPPLIAWILRASTAIGGDGAFWIRLPLPLIHAATALVLMRVARRLYDARTGALAGAAFVSLPGVAVGCLLVSTDTPMLLCLALALAAHLNLAERRSAAWAVALGAAVGAGLLAKYAIAYYPLMALLSALAVPQTRIARRDAGLAAGVALAIVAPNLAWNAVNDLATLQHTADNADWGGPGLDSARLAEFLAGQFAVAGPVLFAAYVAAMLRLRADWPRRALVAFSLPVLGLVSVQALLAGANANWAAAAHPAAAIAGVAVLHGRPRWLTASFAINLAVTAALPVAAIFPDRLRGPGGELLLARYVGRADLSRQAASVAQAEGLDTLVAADRGLLADFFYTLRDEGLAIHAAPVEGFPPHHYAQAHPLPPGPGAVLYITTDPSGPTCPEAAAAPRPVATWRPEAGFITRDVHAFRVPRACWFGPEVEA